MYLYQYPEIYSALRSPDSSMLAGARRAVARYFRGEPRSLMDPACGPANWLLPFARDGMFVAGNDLSGEMVQQARRVLQGFPSEVVQGDMRDLRFSSGPFDVAVELAGTVSQLDPVDFDLHLRSVASHLRPGGIFLMSLFFHVPRVGISTPFVSYQSGDVALERGGYAQVTYEVVEWDPSQRREQMRRTVRVRGASGVPDVFEDAYSLRIWQEDEVREQIDRTGLFEIEDMDAIQDGGASDSGGERTLVLRKRSA